MIKHYLSLFKLDGDIYAYSWLEIPLLGRNYRFMEKMKKMVMHYYA